MTYASGYHPGPSLPQPANTNNGLAKGASLAAFIITILTTVVLEVVLLAGGELIVRISNQVAAQAGLGELDPQTLRGALVVAAVAILLGALIPIGLSAWMWQAARRSSRGGMLAPLIILSLLELSSVGSGLAATFSGVRSAPYGNLPTTQASPGLVVTTNLPWLIVLALCWIGWATMRDARRLTAPAAGYVMPPSGYYAPPPPVGQPGFGAEPYGQPEYGQPGYGQPGYGQPPSTQPSFGQPPQGTPDQPDGQSGFGAPPAPDEPPH